MADPTIAETPEQYREAAKEMISGGLEAVATSDVAKFLAATVADIVSVLLKVGFTALGPVGEGFTRGIAEAEDQLAPLLARYATVALNDTFGTELSEATFSRVNGSGRRVVAGDALGRALMAQMVGTAGKLTPSDVAANKYVGAMAGAAIEDWFKRWFFETISSLVPALNVGQIENYGDLSDKVANVLGLGRVSQRVLRPVVDATIVEPLRWKVNKEHTPTLLSAEQCARQILRGRDEGGTWREMLRWHGHSEANIDAILNAQSKFFSPSDVRTFSYREHWSQDKALQHLRDQGYTEDAAADALRLEGLRRFDELEGQEANAIVAAYVSGHLDRAGMAAMLADAVTPAPERALLTELAEVRRLCARRPLTSAEAEQCVKAGILSVVDYRRALIREGRTDEAVAALELLLRWELDKARSIEEHKADVARERAAEQAERDRLAALKKAEVDAARALRRRGPTSRLESIAVRGGIPIARVAELYAAEFDPDTVQILVDDLEDRRAAYVAREAAAERARVRAAQRSVDVGSLERAVQEGVLTLDEFGRRLQQLGFSGDDAGLLTDTLGARLDALVDAQRARDEAAAAAKVRRIDLGRFETLVRRGYRTLGDYRALVASLGFDEAAQAAMAEWLQLQIADDAAAAQLRADAAAQLRAKGLSLDQFRRAVLLGLTPIADYGPFLLVNGFTADAIKVLVAELQHDVDEAEAARARRADADRRSQAGRAPLSDVRRAARLGLIPIPVYVARLTAAGYPDDDVALEIDLLAQEIADIETARAERAAAEAASRARGLSLAQVERLVRAGLSTVPAYVAAARAAGFTEDAAAALGALLDTELAAAAAAQQRKDALAAAARVKHASLAQLEAAVLAKVSTLDRYAAALRGLEYPDDDVQLLVGLLGARVARQQAAEARQAAIDAANETRALARADVVKAVMEGLRTPQEYADFLTAQGYVDDDVALLVDLLLIALDAKAAKAATDSGG